MGGGLKGGRVIGKTDREGATVTERGVSAIDFMATVCDLLGIDRHKVNITPTNRPIRIVDKEAKPIRELLS